MLLLPWAGRVLRDLGGLGVPDSVVRDGGGCGNLGNGQPGQSSVSAVASPMLLAHLPFSTGRDPLLTLSRPEGLRLGFRASGEDMDES